MSAMSLRLLLACKRTCLVSEVLVLDKPLKPTGTRDELDEI